MAVVLQAEDVNLGRTVAIKLLRKKVKHLSRTEQVEQFFREAMCAASLDHPNIVQIYGFHEYQGHWLLVLEHLEGGSLGKAMERNGPLSPRRASLFLADAAAGVAEAHTAGILHRDIKPSNLLLTRTGRCKIADFGLALPMIQGDDFRLSSGAVGTPHFLAPEILQMRPATAASDVYSLAATLYAIMTGRPPFPTDNRKELLRVVLETPPPDVREIVPHASQALAELIEQGLSKKPYQRLSADEMAGVLRTEVAGLSDVAFAPKPMAPGRFAAPSEIVAAPSEIVAARSEIPPASSQIAPPRQAPAQRQDPAPTPAAQPTAKKAVVYWRGIPVPRR